MKSDFRLKINDIVNTYNRNLLIIDRYRKCIQGNKNGKSYTTSIKMYKYKCLDCEYIGDTDEYKILSDKNPHFCKNCGKKCIRAKEGVNDITTTAPWMVKYFKNGADDAKKYYKYSKQEIEFVCPDCGRVIKKKILNVMSNHGLSCICSDGISYPNKFIYSILSQFNIKFQTEVSFEWSNKRIYDFYIEHNDLKIIIEANGMQHYKRSIVNSKRTLDEEKSNDVFKKDIAIKNGISKYYQIDCSKSEPNFIFKSICKTDLLDILGVCSEKVDIYLADEFATSNLTKYICKYKEENKEVTLHEIAKIFNKSYKTVLEMIKKGKQFGWTTYNISDDSKLVIENNLKATNEKPIYCQTNDMYYRNANIAAEHLSTNDIKFSPRVIRKTIDRGNQYFKHRFNFITQKEFNDVKVLSPKKAIGKSFVIH